METKKTYKSFRFKNTLIWNTGLRGRTSAPGKPEMEIGSPTEFKGDPGVWTFVSWAQNKGVQVVVYESKAEGLLENVDGKYRITEVSVQPSVGLKSQTDVEVARAIMDEVEENCFISNSIRAKVKLAPQFRIGSEKAPSL